MSTPAGQIPLGGLRKRVKPFTPIPNSTIEDWTLSYRALGLLVRILRMPEGFVIRSEQLANEGKGRELRGRKAKREGREAIRTTLRELALGGYYRLEKVRLLSGAFIMQNAIGEDPDPLWAEQAAIFDGKAVPLYQQPDGSLLVRYPNGDMRPDGFPPPERPEAGNDLDDPGEADKGEEDTQTPETGFRAPGLRAPANPASGDAEPGGTGPLMKRVNEDGQQGSVPASQVRRGEAIQGAIDGNDKTLGPRPATNEDIAFGIANDWISYRVKRGVPVAGGRPQHQLKSLVLPFLNAGYTKNEIKNAMAAVDEGIASKQQIQRELDRIRTGRPTGRAALGRQGRRSGADVEGEWADVRPRQYATASGGGADQW